MKQLNVGKLHLNLVPQIIDILYNPIFYYFNYNNLHIYPCHKLKLDYNKIIVFIYKNN